MISQNNRLIIIDGVPFSGTTILTYLLMQHPDVVCKPNGQYKHLLEDDLIINMKVKGINGVLALNPNKRVLLKRPLLSLYRRDFMMAQMPDARYIYCIRPLKDVCESWSKPFRPDTEHRILDNDFLRNCSIKMKSYYYKNYFRRGLFFGKEVNYFYKFYHKSLLKNPKETMKGVNAWLNLSDFDYDVSKVANVDIKQAIIKNDLK